MTIVLRYGLAEERVALEELQRSASLVWEEYRAALLAHPDAIQLPTDQLLAQRVRVAEIARPPVGFSVTLPVANDAWELDGLFVDPAHWRKGIGTALVADAVALVRQQGGRFVDVTANPRAEGFYLNFGFVLSGRADTQFGQASRMRYTIPNG